MTFFPVGGFLFPTYETIIHSEGIQGSFSLVQSIAIISVIPNWVKVDLKEGDIHMKLQYSFIFILR